MKEQRIAQIVSSEPSVWGSCRVIVPLLMEAHQREFSNSSRVFHYYPSIKNSEILKLAKEIRDYDPTHLVFIDHLPHPYPLLEALQLQKFKTWPEIFIHLYGDFTWYASEWLLSERVLKGKRVHFFCASHRQRSLVQGFAKSKKGFSVCPFPASQTQYVIDPELRKKQRQELQVGAKDQILVYTGRVSLQKNIIRMLFEFETALKRHPNLRLWIAGTFDQMGAPFFGLDHRLFSLNSRWTEVWNQLSVRTRERIQFLGQKNAKELNQIYNGGDLYFSLSTYHDEDFGMSPLEAGLTGCPGLLTNWGGYTSFQIDPKSVQLIKVRSTAKGLTLTSSDIQKKMDIMLKNANSREIVRQGFVEHFSVESVQVKLRQALGQEPSEFLGFNQKLVRFVERINKMKMNQAPLFETGPRDKSFYFEIYRHYNEAL